MYIFIFLAKQYCLGKTGGLCSDDGRDFVTTIDDCKNSVPYLKEDYPKVKFASVAHADDKPKGCYLLVGSQTLWFNERTGSPASKRAQVCTSCPPGAYFFTKHILKAKYYKINDFNIQISFYF